MGEKPIPVKICPDKGKRKKPLDYNDIYGRRKSPQPFRTMYFTLITLIFSSFRLTPYRNVRLARRISSALISAQYIEPHQATSHNNAVR